MFGLEWCPGPLEALTCITESFWPTTGHSYPRSPAVWVRLRLQRDQLVERHSPRLDRRRSEAVVLPVTTTEAAVPYRLGRRSNAAVNTVMKRLLVL